MQQGVGIGVTLQTGAFELDAANPKGSSLVGREPVDIIAQPCASCPIPYDPTSLCQVVFSCDLEVGRISLDKAWTLSVSLDQGYVVGQIRMRCVLRLCQPIDPTALRSLHCHKVGTVHNKSGAVTQRIDNRDSGCGGARGFHRPDHAVDQRFRDEGPCCVVNQNEFHAQQPLAAQSTTLLARSTPRCDLDFRRQGRPIAFQLVGRTNDYDLSNSGMPQVSIYRPLPNWPSAKSRSEFVPAEAGSSACGQNDRANPHLMLPRFAKLKLGSFFALSDFTEYELATFGLNDLRHKYLDGLTNALAPVLDNHHRPIFQISDSLT